MSPSYMKMKSKLKLLFDPSLYAFQMSSCTVCFSVCFLSFLALSWLFTARSWSQVSNVGEYTNCHFNRHSSVSCVGERGISPGRVAPARAPVLILLPLLLLSGDKDELRDCLLYAIPSPSLSLSRFLSQTHTLWV